MDALASLLGDTAVLSAQRDPVRHAALRDFLYSRCDALVALVDNDNTTGSDIAAAVRTLPAAVHLAFVRRAGPPPTHADSDGVALGLAAQWTPQRTAVGIDVRRRSTELPLLPLVVPIGSPAAEGNVDDGDADLVLDRRWHATLYRSDSQQLSGASAFEPLLGGDRRLWSRDDALLVVDALGGALVDVRTRRRTINTARGRSLVTAPLMRTVVVLVRTSDADHVAALLLWYASRHASAARLGGGGTDADTDDAADTVLYVETNDGGGGNNIIINVSALFKREASSLPPATTLAALLVATTSQRMRTERWPCTLAEAWAAAAAAAAVPSSPLGAFQFDGAALRFDAARARAVLEAARPAEPIGVVIDAARAVLGGGAAQRTPWWPADLGEMFGRVVLSLQASQVFTVAGVLLVALRQFDGNDDRVWERRDAWLLYDVLVEQLHRQARVPLRLMWSAPAQRAARAEQSVRRLWWQLDALSLRARSHDGARPASMLCRALLPDEESAVVATPLVDNHWAIYGHDGRAVLDQWAQRRTTADDDARLWLELVQAQQRDGGAVPVRIGPEQRSDGGDDHDDALPPFSVPFLGRCHARWRHTPYGVALVRAARLIEAAYGVIPAERRGDLPLGAFASQLLRTGNSSATNQAVQQLVWGESAGDDSAANDSLAAALFSVARRGIAPYYGSDTLDVDDAHALAFANAVTFQAALFAHLVGTTTGTLVVLLPADGDPLVLGTERLRDDLQAPGVRITTQRSGSLHVDVFSVVVAGNDDLLARQWAQWHALARATAPLRATAPPYNCTAREALLRVRTLLHLQTAQGERPATGPYGANGGDLHRAWWPRRARIAAVDLLGGPPFAVALLPLHGDFCAACVRHNVLPGDAEQVAQAALAYAKTLSVRARVLLQQQQQQPAGADAAVLRAFDANAMGDEARLWFADSSSSNSSSATLEARPAWNAPEVGGRRAPLEADIDVLVANGTGVGLVFRGWSMQRAARYVRAWRHGRAVRDAGVPTTAEFDGRSQAVRVAAAAAATRGWLPETPTWDPTPELLAERTSAWLYACAGDDAHDDYLRRSLPHPADFFGEDHHHQSATDTAGRRAPWHLARYLSGMLGYAAATELRVEWSRGGTTYVSATGEVRTRATVDAAIARTLDALYADLRDDEERALRTEVERFIVYIVSAVRTQSVRARQRLGAEPWFIRWHRVCVLIEWLRVQPLFASSNNDDDRFQLLEQTLWRAVDANDGRIEWTVHTDELRAWAKQHDRRKSTRRTLRLALEQAAVRYERHGLVLTVADNSDAAAAANSNSQDSAHSAFVAEGRTPSERRRRRRLIEEIDAGGVAVYESAWHELTGAEHGDVGEETIDALNARYGRERDPLFVWVSAGEERHEQRALPPAAARLRWARIALAFLENSDVYSGAEAFLRQNT